MVKKEREPWERRKEDHGKEGKEEDVLVPKKDVLCVRRMYSCLRRMYCAYEGCTGAKGRMSWCLSRNTGS